MMQKQPSHNLKTFYALSMAVQLSVLIILPVLGFFFLGLWLDNQFNTQPLFLIVAIIIGIIVTFYEIFHSLIPLVKDQDNHHD